MTDEGTNDTPTVYHTITVGGEEIDQVAHGLPYNKEYELDSDTYMVEDCYMYDTGDGTDIGEYVDIGGDSGSTLIINIPSVTGNVEIGLFES